MENTWKYLNQTWIQINNDRCMCYYQGKVPQRNRTVATICFGYFTNLCHVTHYFNNSFKKCIHVIQNFCHCNCQILKKKHCSLHCSAPTLLYLIFLEIFHEYEQLHFCIIRVCFKSREICDIWSISSTYFIIIHTYSQNVLIINNDSCPCQIISLCQFLTFLLTIV